MCDEPSTANGHGGGSQGSGGDDLNRELHGGGGEEEGGDELGGWGDDGAEGEWGDDSDGGGGGGEEGKAGEALAMHGVHDLIALKRRVKQAAAPTL